MRRRAPALAALVALFAFALAIGCTPATVVRVIDGREVRGRFVSDRAYALYARGAEAEARADFAGARVHYLAAVDEDASNAEIWTRIGAVSCKLGRAEDASTAFETAIGQDVAYEPAYRERAACALARSGIRHEEALAALRDAAQALTLDPDSEDAALLYARAADAAGDAAAAERALRELVVRLPQRVAGWTALRDFALHHDLPAASARAAIMITSLGAPPDLPLDSPSKTAPASLADVDEAIARDALDDARSAAKRARLAPADLAVRAAALGHGRLAKTQAELVFKADPTNASAAIALAAASDLLHDDAAIATALADPASLTTAPSPLARLLFAELIDRRADRDAARAYLGPIADPPAGADALLAIVTARVKKTLAK